MTVQAQTTTGNSYSNSNSTNQVAVSLNTDNPLDTSFAAHSTQNKAAETIIANNKPATAPATTYTESTTTGSAEVSVQGTKGISLATAALHAGNHAYEATFAELSSHGVDSATTIQVATKAKELAENYAAGRDGSEERKEKLTESKAGKAANGTEIAGSVEQAQGTGLATEQALRIGEQNVLSTGLAQGEHLSFATRTETAQHATALNTIRELARQEFSANLLQIEQADIFSANSSNLSVNRPPLRVVEPKSETTPAPDSTRDERVASIANALKNFTMQLTE